ncbi:transcriptional regulator prz1 [Diplogelasinospora grovesii]|uniref:Transcriptional regulator prz1 n=1 Tax=Diplogelasinospora grovesii TaxID=303347 RepID=A0AAN6MZY6_9PEZI|nr:transcriptional regulator prz1 [Diplogelasinospora grovesii]
MESEKGQIATGAPLVTATAPQTSAVGASDGFAVAPDLGRPNPRKRGRETTPTPTPSDLATTGGDLSPSKIARLVRFARESPAPLTGAAALEDERHRREDEQRLNPPGTSENPTQRVLSDLMSGVAAMSRPQDAPHASTATTIDGPSAIAAAAAAAARALHPVTIPTTDNASAGSNDGSPQSTESAASLREGTGQVVHSPSAMDVDAQHYQRLHSQQPEAQMEDKTATSLSYPGVMAPGSSMPAPAPPRGMSLPMANSHNQDPSAPRSPSNKKHKCPYCNTEFTRHHNLKSHLLTHSQEKPYVCQQCQMRFRRLHDLKRHGKLHTGEKPHVCPKCERSFARGDALARHSKGAGGCAGRRPSMGEFGGDGEYDASGVTDADDSTMAGVIYDGSADGDMTEEERRRLSLPSIKAQHVPGQPAPEGYVTHPNTYPPAGPRPGAASGGLYPPNVDRGSTSSTTSPSVPNSHTPHTSISSMPLSAGSASLYSQSGMTESPKPLSPAQQPNQAGGAQPQQHAASGLSLPSHGMSQAAQQAWISQYPPADRNATKGNTAATSGPSARGRASAGVAAGQATANGVDNANNLFAAGEPGVWAYLQHLDAQVKVLLAEVDRGKRTEAQLMEKFTQHERLVSALTNEVAALRNQLSAPAEPSPA